MRSTKYVIRKAIDSISGIQFRRIEEAKGDNGSFLITIYENAEKSRKMASKLQDLGLKAGPDGNLLCHFDDWGFHLYYNLPALVRKASTSPDGFPWTHPLNVDSVYNYDKGALPKTDKLFSRSIIQAIPSNCTEHDEKDIIEAYFRASKIFLNIEDFSKYPGDNKDSK
jgi:8-amino-3,8-dideoxy-alpha-D-manno-octulosonate transaminase